MQRRHRQRRQRRVNAAQIGSAQDADIELDEQALLQFEEFGVGQRNNRRNRQNRSRNDSKKQSTDKDTTDHTLLHELVEVLQVLSEGMEDGSRKDTLVESIEKLRQLCKKFEQKAD